MLTTFAFKTAYAYASFYGFVSVALAAEMAFPRERTIDRAARLRSILFYLIFIPVGIICGMLIKESSPGLPLAGGLGLIAAPFIFDFFYYWLHRAQHAIPCLWRFHAVHHSAEELGAGAGYHHLAEAPLRALFVSIPLAVFIDHMGVAGFFLALQGIYLHSTTRLHFGPLAWIVADNRVHRIHHSLERRHFDKNFGAFTMIWDRLFGTAYFPNCEWPDVGLADRREPASVREFLLQPFRRTQDAPGRLKAGLAALDLEPGVGFNVR